MHLITTYAVFRCSSVSVQSVQFDGTVDYLAIEFAPSCCTARSEHTLSIYMITPAGVLLEMSQLRLKQAFLKAISSSSVAVPVHGIGHVCCCYHAAASDSCLKRMLKVKVA